MIEPCEIAYSGEKGWDFSVAREQLIALGRQCRVVLVIVNTNPRLEAALRLGERLSISPSRSFYSLDLLVVKVLNNFINFCQIIYGFIS